MDEGIEVRVLGPFEVLVRGELVHVPRGRPRALLATLALAGGRVVPVDVLTDRMWGGEPPRHGRNAVQNNVRRLRQLLGADAVETAVDGYRLAVAPDQVDGLKLLRLVDEAHGCPPERARQLLVVASGLWRGEPLSGVGAGSLERDQGPVLTERYLAALEQRIDIDLAAGQYSEMVAELRELTARYPLRESLWWRLLIALRESGRVAEALDCYDRVRRHLAEHLGTDPSPQLRQLHQRLLAAEPDPAPSAPSSATSSATLSASPSVAVPRQLPPDPGLVGRGAELAVLDDLLGSRSPVCAIHGVGGIGKTALATHWAHRVGSRFPDGQLYLHLRGYGPERPLPPGDAVSTLLRAVGVPAEAVPSDLEEASGLLRTTFAERRTLLLLDNARDADQVRPLLPGGDNLVLVTSRSQLRGLSVRDGARRIALPELPMPDAVALLAATVGEGRVTAEPDAARTLVDLSGRLPLAVRITAELASRFPDARLADLVTELAARHGRLDTLAGDDPATDVRAVFSWSYRALAPELARAFRLLGLHPGNDIGLPAAAALLGVPEAMARGLLAHLTGVHLVEQRRSGRYQLHDLLREYAAERAEVESPDESDPAVIRLLDWYLHTTSNGRYALGFIAATDPPDPVADPVVTPLTFDTSGEARQWYEAERPTLGAALRLAADRGHDRHGWQLAYRLRDFYQLCEDIEDWMVAGNLGYQCAVRLGDPLALHLTANVLAIGYSNLGRFAEAMPILQVALDHARQLGDSVKVSTSLSLLGTCCQWSRDFERSIAYHEQSVATARGGTNRHRLGHSLLNLGCALIEAGKPDPGIGPTEEALAIYRELDATLPQALGLGNLAEAYEGLHRYVEAVEYAEQSIATFTAGGFDPTVGSLLALGRIRVALGERDLARAAWERAVTVLGHHDHPVMPRIRTLLASLDTG